MDGLIELYFLRNNNMILSNKNREIMLYGISLAVLLFLLKWLEFQLVISRYRLDIFIGVIAILFTGLGIWLAQKLTRPKIEVRVEEKEVIVESNTQSFINEVEIEKLGISKRELEVLNLMAQGFSNNEIAEKLFVSLNTIKTHGSNLFIKLDVKRRTQAVEKAKRLNIIS
jgi:two-component system, NarL family, response regulator LiaR